jgi:hypothetical protein
MSGLEGLVASEGKPDADQADMSKQLMLPPSALLPPSPSGKENTPCSDKTWQIVVLGRTFKSNTAAEVADALVETLGIDIDCARKKADAAAAAKAFVVDTSKIYEIASSKADALRKWGLSVSVTSQSSMKDKESASDLLPRKPEGKPLSPQSPKTSSEAKPSYSELFEGVMGPKKPEGSEQRRRRSSFNAAAFTSSDVTPLVAPEIASYDSEQEAPKKNLFKSLVTKHKARIAEEACKPHDSQFLSTTSTTDSASPNPPRVVADTSALLGPRIGSKMEPNARASSKRSDEPKALAGLNARASSKRPGMILSGIEGMWATVLAGAESEVINRRNTPARKNACEMLRFMLFGEVCDSDMDRDNMFALRIGEKSDMYTVMPFWIAMDMDKSGRVDLGEWRHAAERRLHSKFLENSEKDVSTLSPLLTCPDDETEDRFIGGMCEKIGEHLFMKKASMSIDDVLKLLWLGAAQKDLKKMHVWCMEAAKEGVVRVTAPPVLAKAQTEELASIFRDLDPAGEGHVSFEELLERGLLHDYQLSKAKRDWDEDGKGTVDLTTFLEMMCPLGFRATASSTTGTRRDGTRLSYDEELETWRYEEDAFDRAYSKDSSLTRA